jgi:hypothetical protein
MRAIWILTVMTGMILLSTGCEEMNSMLDQFGVRINSDYYEFELAIPPAPAGIGINMDILMQSDIDKILADYGDASASVEKVVVSEAYIEVMDKSPVRNLNAVGSITTKLSTDELAEITIGTIYYKTADAEQLPMEIADADITNYVETAEYRLINYGVLRETTSDTLWLRARLKYELHLNVAAN